jgi:hypothetical protein
VVWQFWGRAAEGRPERNRSGRFFLPATNKVVSLVESRAPRPATATPDERGARPSTNLDRVGNTIIRGA